MESAIPSTRKTGNQIKFVIVGVLILSAIGLLIFSTLQTDTQYFTTVRQLNEPGAIPAGKAVRLSGAVLGDSIEYDPDTLTLRFTVVHVPDNNAEIEAQGGLAEVLHAAVEDSSLPRMQVQYVGVKPDLLRHEAQAIMSGKLGEDGVFYAEELLLKCPTRYEEAVPEQSTSDL